MASLQAQTYPNWECLIINDGSVDDTRNVAEALTVSDGRVRLINQPNGGLSAARNRGLDCITGQYVQFLDADDKILPHKLERQIDLLKNARSLALAYCDYRRGSVEDIDTEPNPPGPYQPGPKLLPNGSGPRPMGPRGPNGPGPLSNGPKGGPKFPQMGPNPSNYRAPWPPWALALFMRVRAHVRACALWECAKRNLHL